ncbi:MAG: hypothetical protein KDE19_14060 [Caldilineaceae bacterium]|nr:hypothetical protein [Caldilineaceae bacterium]
MSSFWPSSIDLSKTQSPRQVLKIAQQDWHNDSGGVMELLLQDTVSQTGDTKIVVYAKHVPSNRTTRLFAVVHQPNEPYPVTIELETRKLPNFLKKTYYQPSQTDIVAGLMGTKDKTISNPWVSTTPNEFEKKLKEAINEDVVRSQIVNLLADSSDDIHEELQENSVKEPDKSLEPSL